MQLLLPYLRIKARSYYRLLKEIPVLVRLLLLGVVVGAGYVLFAYKEEPTVMIYLYCLVGFVLLGRWACRPSPKEEVLIRGLGLPVLKIQLFKYALLSVPFGMLKKLYLLGLLLQHNDILLLDEPFNGLDFKSAAFVTALIENVREQGRTVFVASHDMDHLFSYAETISLLKDKGLAFYSGKDSFAQIGTSIREEALAKVRGAGL